MKLNLDPMPHQRAVALRARPNHHFDQASIAESLGDIVRFSKPLSPVAVCPVGVPPDAVRILIGLLSQQGVESHAGELPPGFPLHRRDAAIVILAGAPKSHHAPLHPTGPGLNRVSQPAQITPGRSATAHKTTDANAGLNRLSRPGWKNFRG